MRRVTRNGGALLAGTMVLMAACGQSAPSSATAHPSAVTPSPTNSTGLFAVLEARQHQGFDTIAIAGIDGYAKAKTAFAPRAVPQIFDAFAVLQPEAYVAAGGAYFIDGKGVVRRLDPSGSIQTVATFALTSSQQTASFAVSPDGKRLMAAVLTYPSFTPPTGQQGPTQTSPWRLDIESASAGGSAKLLRHWEGNAIAFPGQPGGDFQDVRVVSWDATGPIAVVDDGVAAQNSPLPGARFFDGHLAYLHDDGAVGASLGGDNCPPFGLPRVGEIICASYQHPSVSVRSLNSKTLWSGPLAQQAGSLEGDFALSLDGARLAMDGQVVSLSDGSKIQLATNFNPAGWLNSSLLIGVVPPGNGVMGGGRMAVVHLDKPTQVEDWGFNGLYVGTFTG